MSEVAERYNRSIPLIRIVLFGILALGVIPAAPLFIRAFNHFGFHPHLPNLALWATMKPQIQFHVLAAVSAFGVGLVMLVLPKGTGLHKTLGWGWVLVMAATAISSFFITGLNGDFWSIIHLLSGWTVVALPMAIYAIRNGNVAAHRRTMLGLYLGGLLIAGALAFIPGRLMYMMFFG